MKIKSSAQGFTLLEILLVVAAIAILAGIVIIAINPAKQLGETRNAQRRADVNTILNAVYQHSVDNSGGVPASIPVGSACGVAAQQICKTGGTCTGIVDLSTSLVGATAKYLVAMPVDPTAGTTNGTGYQVYKSTTTGRITVCAPAAEQSATITVTR